MYILKVNESDNKYLNCYKDPETGKFSCVQGPRASACYFVDEDCAKFAKTQYVDNMRPSNRKYASIVEVDPPEEKLVQVIAKCKDFKNGRDGTTFNYFLALVPKKNL